MTKSKFYDKYAFAQVVKVNQFDHLPKWGAANKGICRAMVNDWFRRIENGRLTWLNKKRFQGGVDKSGQVDWTKKAPRLIGMQYGQGAMEDPKFFPTGREVEVASNTVKYGGEFIVHQSNFQNTGFTQQEADTLARTILDYDPRKNDDFDQNKYQPDLFFSLNLERVNDSGHVTGIHLNNTKQPREVAPEEDEDEESWQWTTAEFEVTNQDVHFFDPNMGEWIIGRHHFAQFLFDLYEVCYSGYTFLNIKRFTSYVLAYCPVWWDVRAHSH